MKTNAIHNNFHILVTSKIVISYTNCRTFSGMTFSIFILDISSKNGENVLKNCKIGSREDFLIYVMFQTYVAYSCGKVLFKKMCCDVCRGKKLCKLFSCVRKSKLSKHNTHKNKLLNYFHQYHKHFKVSTFSIWRRLVSYFILLK